MFNNSEKRVKLIIENMRSICLLKYSPCIRFKGSDADDYIQTRVQTKS